MEGSLVAYKVFTNGSVLQASEINENLMRQSVMVFSNAAARSAAITVPLEGMLTWLEDIDQYQNYNGSAWVQTITPAGYSLIKTQAIGTSVTAVTVTGAFSTDYDVYQIVVSGGAATVANTGMRMILGSTTTNYRTSLIYQSFTSSTVLGDANNSNSSFSNIGRATSNGLSALMTVSDPFLTRPTFVSANWNQLTDTGVFNGILNDSTSYTAFTLQTVAAGAWTGGTVYVYGLRKA
jgi:hypothetical protein